MNFDVETASVAPASKSRSLRPDMETLPLPELRLEGRERRSRLSVRKNLEYSLSFDLEAASLASASKRLSLRPDLEILPLPELRLEGEGAALAVQRGNIWNTRRVSTWKWRA